MSTEIRPLDACELCTSTQDVVVVPVSPFSDNDPAHRIALCSTCRNELAAPTGNGAHWRCLQTSIWSTVPVVQVVAWRQLKRLTDESWATDLLDQVWLDDELRAWAENDATTEAEAHAGDSPRTVDSLGNELQNGDSVTLIKDLDVKGTSFTAKRGTLVKGIRLTNNPEHIEGRVNGVQIVLKTMFLKKS